MAGKGGLTAERGTGEPRERAACCLASPGCVRGGGPGAACRTACAVQVVLQVPGG